MSYTVSHDVSAAVPNCGELDAAHLDKDTLTLSLKLQDGRKMTIPIRDVLHEARAVNLVTRVCDDSGRWVRAPHQRGRFVGVRSAYKRSDGGSHYIVDDKDTANDLTSAIRKRLRSRNPPVRDDDDVEIVGERTVEERNAEGFANAEIVD